MRAVRFVAIGVVAVAACATRPAAPPRATAPATLPTAVSAAGSSDGEPPRDEALWKQAGQGDELDLERLAAREGAVGLLAAVREGGTVSKTALAALPFAEDAELALGPLCDSLASQKGAGEALRAVQAIASRLPASAERLDVEGARRCFGVLGELERSTALDSPSRDLAASARALLEEARRP